MLELTPKPAIDAPDQTIGTVTIAQNTGVALASVAARKGQLAACEKTLNTRLGAVPQVGKAVSGKVETGFWTGAEQWMISAPEDSHEDLAEQWKRVLGAAASVTEQSGGWVVFDVSGANMPAMCELLCSVPIRKMETGDVQRTMIHQLGCFVICCDAGKHIRILGPRASALSLHHALTAAATSVA
ncbi:sarcosine oxidase subunit gamma [Neptunicoccus cionae]|uniref:sarcosine oxidase subunit gamma n=1 Tax=Neptunicoccus cionae TaxID=2035344 RepID=UPI00256FE37E|nr:sarcosine oxidase subunit gamma [Amylibacter cionae]